MNVRGASVAASAALVAAAVAACQDTRVPAPSAAATEPADAPKAAPRVVASAASSAPASSASSASSQAAIAGPRVEALAVAGHPSAVLAVPVGEAPPAPLVVATHGNFDRPEWQCEVWSQIVKHRAFVLCPRGAQRPDSPSPLDVRFTYASNQALEAEVDAALAALRASPRGREIAEGPPLWAGFSLGAIMGVAIAARRPSDFPRLVLIEGGSDRFGDDVARTFAKGGGKAVLFVCAQRGCQGAIEKRKARAIALGVEAGAVYAGAVGHAYDGPVAEAVARALPAFVASDPRWSQVDSAAGAR